VRLSSHEELSRETARGMRVKKNTRGADIGIKRKFAIRVIKMIYELDSTRGVFMRNSC